MFWLILIGCAVVAAAIWNVVVRDDDLRDATATDEAWRDGPRLLKREHRDRSRRNPT